jgi:hypothetical protein
MYDGTGVFSSTHTAVVPTCVVKAGIQPKITKISHENLLSKILSVYNKNNIFPQTLTLCSLNITSNLKTSHNI